MTLNKETIKSLFASEMEAADLAMAQDLNINVSEVNNSQKVKERNTQAEAQANVLFKVLTQFAEIEMPAHPPASTMTGPAPGPGLHIHATNQPPIEHINGKII